MTDLRNGTITIVGHRLNQKCHTARAITFVSNLFVVNTFFFTRSASNRTINRVVGHVATLGIEDGLAQSCIAFWIAATRTRGDSDFFNKLREKFAALGIERTLLVLNTMPLRMSGHLS